MLDRISGNTSLFLIAFVSIASILTYLGVSANIFVSLPQADMRLSPAQFIMQSHETFTVDLVVTSSIPVNVFSGNLSFNPELLRIEKIDYNTSIANLWAELPWYHNGEGTINFAGGTTKPGGFTGEGSLITITFEALEAGAGKIIIDEARILQHDGLGTDADLAPSIDTIVTVTDAPATQEILYTSGQSATFLATSEPRSTDLNNDGKQSIADTSIFMADLATQNERSDFNEDGRVTLKDLSILMRAE